MKRPEFICFDFDGTLCNTLPDIAASMNRVLRRRNYPEIPENKVREFIGSGIIKLVERALRYAVSREIEEDIDPMLLETLGMEMSEYYSRHLTDRSYLYPGVETVLMAFRDIPQIIVSNKPEAMVRNMLKHYGIRDYFDLIVGGDTLAVSKPDVAVWEYVAREMKLSGDINGWMIGDSLPDVQFGKIGRLRTIVVSYGYNDVSVLRNAGADTVIHDLRELIGMSGQ
jgi:phosphoglycolate phosphatase